MINNFFQKKFKFDAMMENKSYLTLFTIGINKVQKLHFLSQMRNNKIAKLKGLKIMIK